MDLQTTKFEIKIGDFGFAKFLNSQQKSNTICGTPLYMAPQLVEERNYSYKADLWSLGVLYFELLTGKHPFEGKSFE